MTKISIFIVYSSIICGVLSYIPAKSVHDRVKRWENGGNMGGTGDMSNMFRGTAGVDYPDFKTIPNTSFRCEDQELYEGGLYADVEAKCQVYHVCHDGRKDSFLCGRGTIFNQQILACDYWYSAECDNAPSFYYLNSQIGNSVSSDTFKNYPNGNQNYPNGNQQNHPSGNQQNYPSGNQQNYPNVNQQNYPTGNQQNYPSGNQQNYPSGNRQIPGRTDNVGNGRQIPKADSYGAHNDRPCNCIKNNNARPWSFPAFPASAMHGSDK